MLTKMDLTPYLDTPEGIVWMKPTQGGPIPTRLTNFTAKILADIVKDDGIETQTTFQIEAAVGKRRKIFIIRPRSSRA